MKDTKVVATIEDQYIAGNTISITEFIISRKCNISLNDLVELRCKMLDNCIIRLKDLKRIKEVLINNIINNLYYEIPKLNPIYKEVIIQIKRDVYNDRNIKLSDLKLINQSGLTLILEELQKLISIKSEIEELNSYFQKSYLEYFSASRNLIAKICSNEYFLKAIQLSGQRLIKITNEYKLALKSDKYDKKIKKIEETLLSYIYRMALKPSPFASFTTIIAHINNKYVTSTPNKEYSSCLISRTLVQWLAGNCLKYPELKLNLPLRINSTVKIINGELIFFTRADESSKNIYGGEKFIKIKSTEILNQITLLLSTRTFSKLQLVESLCNSKNEVIHYENYIENLIEIGLIERCFQIPDLTDQYALDVANIIDKFQNKELQLLASKFTDIHEIETKFQIANAEKREELLLSLKSCIIDIINILGLENPGLENARTFIYEDVGRIVDDVDKQISEFSSYINEFDMVAKILPIFDDAIIERLAIYTLYKKLVTEPQGSIELLEFYKRFASLSVEQLSKIMVGTFSEEVQVIRNLRKQWNIMLNNILQNNPNIDSISLNEGWVKNFISSIPMFVYDSTSRIFYLQKCELKSNKSLIFNGASTGYGALYSRFCSIYGKKNNIVLRALVDALKNNFDINKIYDLTAVLGVNTNIHPVIFDNFIEYPNCISSFESPKYTLNEIKIIADDKNKRLRLVHNKSGEHINLIPLNFLFPAMGPNLYRFLYLFTPFTNFKGGFWRNYLDVYGEGITVLPRLKIGNLCLDRKTWKFPIHQLPKYPEQQTNIISFFEQLYEWRNMWKIPKNVFYRQSDPKHVDENWVTAMRKYIQFANKTKLRKPHFLDFENPLLLKIFFKSLALQEENDLIIQECLPENDYININDKKFVEEYLIQINTGGNT